MPIKLLRPQRIGTNFNDLFPLLFGAFTGVILFGLMRVGDGSKIDADLNMKKRPFHSC